MHTTFKHIYPLPLVHRPKGALLVTYAMKIARPVPMPAPNNTTMLEDILLNKLGEYWSNIYDDFEKWTLFIQSGGMKFFVSTIYFSLNVALAGRFRPQCSGRRVLPSRAGGSRHSSALWYRSTHPAARGRRVPPSRAGSRLVGGSGHSGSAPDS